MATTLIARGVNVELDDSESFNKVKGRIAKAKKMHLDYLAGSIDAEEYKKIEKLLQFKTDNGDGTTGRVWFDVQDNFGVASNVAKDVKAADDSDEEEE